MSFGAHAQPAALAAGAENRLRSIGELVERTSKKSMFDEIAATINGRRIWRLRPVGHYVNGWFTVEMRGPMFQGRPFPYFKAFETLADAIAEAERLGPITDFPDEPN